MTTDKIHPFPVADIFRPAYIEARIRFALAGKQMNVSWNPSTDNIGVVGYILYRNGTEIANGNFLSFIDSDLLPNTSYSYTVAAYDAAGNISAQSSAVAATTSNIVPSTTTGIFSSFWLYGTSQDTKTLEIDIFETNDLTPSFWKTNFQDAGGGFSFIVHNNSWCDNQFHTYGLLWQQNSLKTYKDNVFDGSWENSTGPSFFDHPMRLMITHTCDPSWASGGSLVPYGVDAVYMDIDYIRVWRA